MFTKKAIVYPIIILSMIFWSMSFVWYKIVYQYFEPITTIFLRLIISSILLLIFTLIFKKLQKVKKEDYGLMIILAFFQPFLYFVGESFGMLYVSSTVAAVVISTIPLFTPILAFFLFGERISFYNVAGIFISFFGVLMVIFNKNLTITASPKGLLLLFIAVVAALSYSALIIKLTKKYNSYTIITVQNVIGIFFFLPLFLIFDFKSFINITFTWKMVLPLIELAVFASSLAFVFFIYGIKELGITKANMFCNVIPVFTAILAFFILKETLSSQKFLGIFIVIGGLFLSQINFKKLKGKNYYLFKRFNYRT
ncbi:MAG: DMT family transporter [Bacteroidales bacterium]|nr:DMT family transporter [Bacteroidales bacterium]